MRLEKIALVAAVASAGTLAILAIMNSRKTPVARQAAPLPMPVPGHGRPRRIVDYDRAGNPIYEREFVGLQR